MIKNVQLNPELAQIELGKVKLTYSKHALEQMEKRGIILLPSIEIIKGSVVEMELNPTNMKCTKILARLGYTAEYDQVFVLRPDLPYLKVVTMWLNHVDDVHLTLGLAKQGGK